MRSWAEAPSAVSQRDELRELIDEARTRAEELEATQAGVRHELGARVDVDADPAIRKLREWADQIEALAGELEEDTAPPATGA